jgi:F5/8 type C domain
MPTPDQVASPFRAAPSLPLDRRYGGKITAYDQLPIHALGDQYVVEGNGTVTSLPALPIGETVMLEITGSPTFTHSAKLICQNALSYSALPGDLLILRSDGDGIWRVYVIPNIQAAGLKDIDRRNILLNHAYLSKMYGLSGISGSAGYRRAINVFADGFTTATGANSGASSNYAFDNISGLVAPSNSYGANQSTSGNAIAGVAAPGGGTAAQSADGITSGANGWISGETSSGVSGVSYVGQNFGSTKHIRQIVLYQGYNGDATYSITSALVQYSDNGTTWATQSTITPTATIGAQTFALAASGLHQYWRLLANSAPGAAARWGVAELQMMELSLPNNMIYVTATQTADASVSNASVLLEFDNTAAPTLNTDLTVEVTCNGGTNWTAATLSSISSNSQAGRMIVETVDQATTAGTSFAARVKTFNNKNIGIYALTLTVH